MENMNGISRKEERCGRKWRYSRGCFKSGKIKDPVFVASKNFFNQSGEIIGCPILGESTESPLHIYVEMNENKGYIQCEQMKMLDLRVRGYKIIDRVKMADVINVTDAIQSIFDYI